jgi:hypothetical protein
MLQNLTYQTDVTRRQLVCHHVQLFEFDAALSYPALVMGNQFSNDVAAYVGHRVHVRHQRSANFEISASQVDHRDGPTQISRILRNQKIGIESSCRLPKASLYRP